MKISKNLPPFIIAEMSGNHNQSLERAMLIIEEAAKAGADAIKFQTYTPDTMTLNCRKKDFMIDNPNSLWYGKNLYDLYQEAHTPWEWHESLFKKARELGLIPFSTPFDLTAVDFLETLKPDLYKIASFEITHLPLIEKVAKTGKPIIISTGVASENDISNAVNTAKNAGATKIILLKCTSAYPADANNANLLTIPDMAQKFGLDIGLSDHTLGIGVAVAAVSYGAVVIEKHFTLNRESGGVDSQFSLTPSEFRLLKDETTRAWNAKGKVIYGGTEAEQYSKVFRQSIWPTKDIKAGEKFSADNVKICRPGLSLEPKYHKGLLGKKAKRDISFGERILDSDFK